MWKPQEALAAQTPGSWLGQWAFSGQPCPNPPHHGRLFCLEFAQQPFLQYEIESFALESFVSRRLLGIHLLYFRRLVEEGGVFGTLTAGLLILPDFLFFFFFFI